jgi:hypothetical protein
MKAKALLPRRGSNSREANCGPRLILATDLIKPPALLQKRAFVVFVYICTFACEYKLENGVFVFELQRQRIRQKTIYIHTHTYTHTYIHTYLPKERSSSEFTKLLCNERYKYMYICIHIYIYVCVYMYMYICIYTYIYTHTYTHICVLMHTYIYAYT